MRRPVTEKASGRAVAAQAALAAVEHRCRLSLRSFVPVARRLCGCTRWWVRWERWERGERPRLLRAGSSAACGGGGATGGASSSFCLLVLFFFFFYSLSGSRALSVLLGPDSRSLRSVKKNKNKVQESCEVLSLWFRMVTCSESLVVGYRSGKRKHAK